MCMVPYSLNKGLGSIPRSALRATWYDNYEVHAPDPRRALGRTMPREAWPTREYLNNALGAFGITLSESRSWPIFYGLHGGLDRRMVPYFPQEGPGRRMASYAQGQPEKPWEAYGSIPPQGRPAGEYGWGEHGTSRELSEALGGPWTLGGASGASGRPSGAQDQPRAPSATAQEAQESQPENPEKKQKNLKIHQILERTEENRRRIGGEPEENRRRTGGTGGEPEENRRRTSECIKENRRRTGGTHPPGLPRAPRLPQGPQGPPRGPTALESPREPPRASEDPRGTPRASQRLQRRLQAPRTPKGFLGWSWASWAGPGLALGFLGWSWASWAGLGLVVGWPWAS